MKTVKIDVTLLVVLLTALAYGATYIYERTYQAYYQLPTEFIDLNINTLTGSLFFIILVVAIDIILGVVLTTLILKLKDPFFENVPIGFFIFVCLMIITAATFGGHIVALKKEEYMVVKQKEELFVVVTSYKDNLVIAPLNIKTDTIKPKFQTIEMKSAKDSEIINFEDGIKVDKLKNSKELKKEIK
ncbi:hypothetical protein MKY06_30050 [Priestia sp. FSL P4-0332]|uniref:hypothetical protein n=1 Tax=Priestia sp. FSL P4-0332 TaxID=2921634 RepID=UPI0030F68807